MSEDATSGQGSVQVVGTAHVSQDSVREVEETIAEERPDVVAVELDEGRYRQMQGGTPDDLEPGDLLRGNTVFQFIAYWMLSYVQAQLGERFDIEPGADMMAAVDAAERHGLDVALVDRDIQTTIQRFWKRMSVLEKLRMVGGLVFGVSDARVVGLTLGVFLGVVAGPLIGLFGGAVGVTDAVLTRVTTGVLLAAVTGYLLLTVAETVVGGDEAFVIGVGGGAAVGLIGGVGLGVGVPVVSRYVGGLFVTAVGSLTLGLTAGILVGGVLGLLVDGLGLVDAPEEEDLDELDMSDLTDSDVVSVMMEEFREFSPGGAEALIDERDAFIAHKLIALRDAGNDVVAVVGAGHREGIEGYLAEPESLPPMSSLVGTERSSGVPWMKIVGTLLSVGFVAFFVLLALAGVEQPFLLRLFAVWFVINGVFAAGLAKLVGARWRSALVGGGLAWLTSINPLLAPGWFAGYVELRHTPVNVADIGKLNRLLSDEEKPIRALVSEMFEVPLFRLIMIVAMTNVGSLVASVLFATYLLPFFAADLGGVDGVTRMLLQGAVRGADVLREVVS
jgi:pheromone shutdown protein TraB